MKSNTPGLILTGILIFNLSCLLIYFLLKFWRHDRKLEEDEGEHKTEDDVTGDGDSAAL